MNLEIPTGNIAAHMPVLEEYAWNCRVLLEIGSEYGTGSTLAFRCGFEANLGNGLAWVTVDWKDRIAPWCRPRFPFWQFVLGDSREADTRRRVGEFLGSEQPDLVFIDTDPNYDQMKAELALWSPIVCDGCVWVFHDTRMNGAFNPMVNAITEFAERDGRWSYRDLAIECHGLGVLEPRK